MDPGVEGRRVVVEILAVLVHIKSAMVDLILKPACVPTEVVTQILAMKDPVTGYPLTKRRMAPLLVDAIDRRPDCKSSLWSILEIAAKWNRFHLADDEFAARAVVEKARELLQRVAGIRADEARRRDLEEVQLQSQRERESAQLFQRH